MIHHTKRRLHDRDFLFGGAVLSILLLSNISNFLLVLKHGIPHLLHKETVQHVFKKDAFNNVTITGKAFVVYDIIDHEIIGGKNATTSLPLASLTKIMTSITARTHHSGTDKVVIRPESIDGAYDLGLKKGQVWTLDELLKYVLVFSSNDGAMAIANTFGGKKKFVEEMNTDASRLGLHLAFTHPAGLDEGGKYGGYGSALEMAKLLAVARSYFPELYDATTRTRVSVRANTGTLTGLPNTNQEINTFFGAEISKTGYTDDAGGNLAIIVDVTLGHPVAIVVLGSTREERFRDVKILYDTLLTSLR